MKKPNMLEEERKKISVRQGPRSQMSEQLPRMRFTPMQRLFVEAYLIHRNATRAAIAAGFSGRSANNQGTRLMANDAIRGK
jgi:Terminase small subunit